MIKYSSFVILLTKYENLPQNNLFFCNNRILYINSLRPSVTKLGSVTDGRPDPARRSKFPVPRVFFQKIYGFRIGISYSQSFFKKDLWFWSSGTGRPGRRTVCWGPKTQVTFETIPPVLYLLSPEYWVLTNPGPKSQRPGFKDPNDKKKPGPGRAAPRCVESRE
jgi:hypothetical protein